MPLLRLSVFEARVYERLPNTDPMRDLLLDRKINVGLRSLLLAVLKINHSGKKAVVARNSWDKVIDYFDKAGISLADANSRRSVTSKQSGKTDVKEKKDKEALKRKYRVCRQPVLICFLKFYSFDEPPLF